MGKALRKYAKKGRKLVRKAAKNPVAKEVARKELEIASDILQKAAQELRQRSRKIK